MHPKNTALLMMAGTFFCSATLAAADGRQLFAANCASCHGVDGKAQTPAGRMFGAKDLGASKLPDAGIEKLVIDGIKDANGKSRMPSFKTRLSPAEIKAVVAHVKTLRR